MLVFAVLRQLTYRRLFTAQVVALLGTGLATVALGLLAYDIAGADASTVLGTALAIKMTAYVAIAPVVASFAGRIPQRALMVSMDLTRAAVALALPFVTQIWQVYVLIFLLQAASAAFTPTFQATLPTVLPAERDYTRALSMSRLAYDLESLFSPALAALLLSLITYNWLFVGTTVGFVASAVLVLSVALPGPTQQGAGKQAAGVRTPVLRGARLFLATPRLRALLALDLAVAAAGAMVIVNTVVLVRDGFQRGPGDVSVALAAYGAGSMVVALLLPRVLDRVGDRRVMLGTALVLPAALAVFGLGSLAGGAPSWPLLLATWAVLGAASSGVLTPTGRLIRRSAATADLPTAFAAQFSLSHSCWLLTYPLAGLLASSAGTTVTAWVLAGLSLLGVTAARAAWPASPPEEPSGDAVPVPVPAVRARLRRART